MNDQPTFTEDLEAQSGHHAALDEITETLHPSMPDLDRSALLREARAYRACKGTTDHRLRRCDCKRTGLSIFDDVLALAESSVPLDDDFTAWLEDVGKQENFRDANFWQRHGELLARAKSQKDANV